MSVLVKGMEMPKCCAFCEIQHDGVCQMNDVESIDDIAYDGRPDWCPLVEIPEKHGRLIDVDALMKDFRMGKVCGEDCPMNWKTCGYDRGFAKMDFCMWLDDAPVIIEAEGVEE